LLGLVTAAGAALRLRDVEHSLWLDELHTAWCVAGDLGDVAPRARIGNYSPAYFYLVWVSTRAAGLNEWGLRLPSLLAGIALIPVMHFATARLTGSRAAGLTAAALVALDGGLAGWYAQEARPLALVQLLAVVHVWLLFELVSSSRRPAAYYALRVLLIGATAALFYLHYTAVLLLCGELAWYAARRLFAGRSAPVHYRARDLTLDLTLAGAACLPAATHLAEIFRRRANWEQFVRQPTWRELIGLFESAPWALAISLLASAAALVLWAMPRGRGQPSGAMPAPAVDRSSRPAAPMLPCCWYLVPLGVAAALTYTGLAHVCYPRYLMASSVALPVAAASGVALAARKHAALAVLVGLLTAWVVQTRPGWGHEAETGFTARLAGSLTIEHFVEDWQGAVEFVRQRDGGSGQPVFLWAGLIEAALMRDEEPPTFDDPSSAPDLEPPMSNVQHRGKDDLPQGSDEQQGLRRYLLFPISGPYALDDGRMLVPLAAHGERWLPTGAAGQVRAAGGGWFIFRSPEALYTDHPKPLERLARDLCDELAEQGLHCRVTQRRSFRGLAVIHLSRS
jgi:hypothetical protein